MSESHPSPFPTALVLDTSFLRTIGGTGTGPYQTFVQYVRTEDRELYLSRGAVEELTEQRGYISVDWVDRADTTEWITLVGELQPGVRVHDGPRAGEVMDRVHERLAAFELLMDDRNAERAIAGVIENSYYEGGIRVIDIWTALEYMESQLG